MDIGHPNDIGHQKLFESIPLELFEQIKQQIQIQRARGEDNNNQDNYDNNTNNNNNNSNNNNNDGQIQPPQIQPSATQGGSLSSTEPIYIVQQQQLLQRSKL